MMGHMELAYRIGLCGTRLDGVEHIRNEADDGTTFPPGVPQCPKCIEKFAPTARWVLDVMLGKIRV